MDRMGMKAAALGAAVVVAAALLVAGGRASALTTTFATVGNNAFLVPAGVTSISIDAFGAEGGAGDSPIANNASSGGAGARVFVPSFTVTPGETLTIVVGGAGGDAVNSPGAPGSPDGGTGGFGNLGFDGGGGGGSSSVLRGADRLVVAGGGGGGGSRANFVGQSNGGTNVAAAGADGEDGASTGVPDESGDGGGGASGATVGAGGSSGDLADSTDGTPGAASFGGTGGDANQLTGGAGGGGGGGFAGGGGGGGGGAEGGISGSGGGGGGGGSSFGPAGATFSAAGDADNDGNGKVVVTFLAPGETPAPPSATPTAGPAAPGGDTTAPDTVITSRPFKKDRTRDRTPTFAFAATEVAAFQCAVDGGQFTPCSSPHELDKLARGQTHVFAVRAVDTAGNVDPTPATRTFEVRKRKGRR